MRGSRVRAASPLLLLAVLAAAPARAAVEGSPHDLIAQGYDVVKASATQERCNRCHIPTAAVSRDLIPDVPPVLAAVYGAPSVLCFSCHDGTTIVDGDVDASRTAFHPASHGTDLSGYEHLRDEMVELPYLAGRHMECITCHDTHDDGHRPFLRRDLGELCLACHPQQVEFGLGEQNGSGNHPQGGEPAAISRPGAPLAIGAAFKTPFPLLYPLAGGRESAGSHWDLGGHHSAGDEGTIICVTCHSVHGDEQSPPRQGDLLAVDPVLETADLFCEGCHAGERGDGQLAPPHPNPGGTTTGRTYHPADDDRSNGDGSIIETRAPAIWPLGKGAGSPILCSTCHSAHRALPSTLLLRPPPEEGIGFCETCHDQMPLEYHHAAPGNEKARCAAKIEKTATNPQGTLSCDLCHRAHNAGLGTNREQDYLPLLRETLSSDELCLRCHPANNPTCGERPDYEASHFLGDPTLPETYQNSAPPYRTTPWPESLLFSRYGGDQGTVMICLSCHAFRAGAVVSGDRGQARHLLARSGNPVEWGEDPGIYLCTGCHGVTPGTGAGEKGHTHPLMEARVETLGREAVAPVTTTPSLHVNCDSCHRPHEARTEGAYYILEVIDSPNKDPKTIHPQIDFTRLCYSCHPEGKY